MTHIFQAFVDIVLTCLDGFRARSKTADDNSVSLKKVWKCVSFYTKKYYKEDAKVINHHFPQPFFLLLMEWFLEFMDMTCFIFLRKAFESTKKKTFADTIFHGSWTNHFIELHIHLEYLQWKRNLRKKAPTDMITGIISKRRKPWRRKKKIKNPTKKITKENRLAKVEKKLTSQTKTCIVEKLEKNSIKTNKSPSKTTFYHYWSKRKDVDKYSEKSFRFTQLPQYVVLARLSFVWYLANRTDIVLSSERRPWLDQLFEKTTRVPYEIVP